MSKMPTVAVIIPAYNEEKTIALTVKDFQAHLPFASIVVVNNNSTDNTFNIANGVLRSTEDFLINETKKGKGMAIKTALSRVSADIYVMVDADTTYSARDAQSLLHLMLEQRCDMVIGDRISGGQYLMQNVRFGHNFGNYFLTKFISLLAGKQFNDVLSGLRVMSRPYIDQLDLNSKGFQLETELNLAAAYLKANVLEVPISYSQRPDDSASKLNSFVDGFKILSFAFFNWVAFKPNQFFICIATFFVMLGASLSYIVINGFLERGWPYTTTAIAAATLLLSALLSLFAGLSLKIVLDTLRKNKISQFLSSKRIWNKNLDNI